MGKKQILEHNKPVTLVESIAEGRGAITVPGATVLKTGLQFKPNTHIEQWAEARQFFKWAGKWRNFAIGDWIVFGEAVYGEQASQFVDELGLTQGQTSKFKWVSQKVENCRRRQSDFLTWEHHHAVAGLKAEDQSHWLEIADEEELSRNELRASIKAGRVVRQDEIDAKKAEKPPKAIVLEEAINTLAGWIDQEEAINTLAGWIDQEEGKQPAEEWDRQRKDEALNRFAVITKFLEKLK